MSEFQPGDVLYLEDAKVTYVISAKGYAYESATRAGYGIPVSRVLDRYNGALLVNDALHTLRVDLDALPVGSVIKDDAGDTLAKAADGWLLLASEDSLPRSGGRRRAIIFSSSGIEQPVTVVFKP
jgi:hypothetical protein